MKVEIEWIAKPRRARAEVLPVVRVHAEERAAIEAAAESLGMNVAEAVRALPRIVAALTPKAKAKLQSPSPSKS